MNKRYKHAGSTEKVISLLGEKNTGKKTPKEDSEFCYSNFTLTLTFHLPHPQQKDMQFSPMHKKNWNTRVVGEANLGRKASKISTDHCDYNGPSSISVMGHLKKWRPLREGSLTVMTVMQDGLSRVWRSVVDVRWRTHRKCERPLGIGSPTTSMVVKDRPSRARRSVACVRWWLFQSDLLQNFLVMCLQI